MLHDILLFFQHFLAFNYAPPGQPFYTGADWPNAFVLLILGPAGYAWSKTKLWPLNKVHVAIVGAETAIKDVHFLQRVAVAHHRDHKAQIDKLSASHDQLHDNLSLLQTDIAELKSLIVDLRDNGDGAKAVQDDAPPKPV